MVDYIFLDPNGFVGVLFEAMHDVNMFIFQDNFLFNISM